MTTYQIRKQHDGCFICMHTNAKCSIAFLLDEVDRLDKVAQRNVEEAHTLLEENNFLKARLTTHHPYCACQVRRYIEEKQELLKIIDILQRQRRDDWRKGEGGLK